MIVTAKNKRLSLRTQDRLERSLAVLFALIELYIRTGRPVGSATLQKHGFESLSPATIRNYLAAFEEEGLLLQEHSSAGRIPTAEAFRIYAHHHLSHPRLPEGLADSLETIVQGPNRDIGAYLQVVTALVSDLTQCAAFCLSPRFDQDLISRIRLVAIDSQRLIAILVTAFGLVHTELVASNRWRLPNELTQLEALLELRLKGIKPEQQVPRPVMHLVEWLYAELLMRQMTRYSETWPEELYRVGASQLLNYPEFTNAIRLSPALTLLEHPTALRELCLESRRSRTTSVFIGRDIPILTTEEIDCCSMVTPYRMGARVVGAIGVVGPLRLPYGEIVGILEAVSEIVSDHLTQSFRQFNISYGSGLEAQRLSASGPEEAPRGNNTLFLEDYRYFEDEHESN